VFFFQLLFWNQEMFMKFNGQILRHVMQIQVLLISLFVILKCNLFLISLKRVNYCFDPSSFSCNTFYKFWRENSCLKHTQYIYIYIKAKWFDEFVLDHVHTIKLNYQFKTFTLAFPIAGKVTQPNFTHVKADKLSCCIQVKKLINLF
jgi:hypothetical protein